MKTFATTLEAIGSWPALRAAWRTYRSGKRRRPAVAAFELDGDRHLLGLSRRILTGRYRHGAYKLMVVRDPKPRLIAVAPVRDRIVHTAVHQALAPQFDAALIDDVYACRQGRGSHRAVLRYVSFQRRFRWLMHLDIQGYYPRVDHQILFGLLAPRLRDRRVADLLAEILASGWRLYRRPRSRRFFELPQLTSEARPQGLPIGNLTSQWWGNLYLNGLDHFIKRDLKIQGYLRYMDDFVCFGDDAAAMRRQRAAIRDWLLSERRLRLHPRKGHLRPARLAQTFLGWRVSRQGWDLGPKAVRRFRDSLPALALGDPERLRRVLTSWRGLMQW